MCTDDPDTQITFGGFITVTVRGEEDLELTIYSAATIRAYCEIHGNIGVRARY